MKKVFAILFAVLAIAGSWYLYKYNVAKGLFSALATVPCIDDYRPILKKFTLNISITVFGKNFPLDSKIGYDHGTCVRAIHTDDASGKAIVVYNDYYKNFTLGNFFEVWHKRFNNDQLFAYSAKGHNLKVYINGNLVVSKYDEVILAPNQQIRIEYY